MDKLEMKTARISQENIEKIRGLFPNAVTEIIKDGKVELAVDFDVLKQELSDSLIEAGQERYQMTWPDKKKSVLLANSAISATLRPCREESVDFDTTQNLYIEGDNLDVLKLLRETYLGKVKMIYIDPPYNTGNDFVYEDDFAQSVDDYKGNSGQYDEQGDRLFQNTESNGRFHTDWLNMIYPRLKIARDLLSDDGVIFISIDDNEQANLKKVCDEIFGESSFVATLIWRKIYGIKNDVKTFSISHDYILVYSRQVEKWKPHLLPRSEEANSRYKNPDNDPRGPWKAGDFTGVGATSCVYEIVTPSGKILYPPKGKHWIASQKNYEILRADNRIWFGVNGDNVPSIKRFLSEVKNGLSPSTFIDYSEGGHSDEANKELKAILGDSFFDYPKPTKLVFRLSYLGTEKDSIILDFFSGSATTAHAVMQLNAEDGGNRKFIMVQLPEKCDEKSEAYKAGYKNICEIGKERIRRAGKKIKEETGKTDLDTGFRVLKLDSSNMQDVFYNPAAMTQDLLSTTINNVKPDRTPMDLLFQIMLELGVQLSAKIEEKEICGKKYYVVNENEIIACFDDNLNNDVITEIAKQQPLYAVFKDKSFATDSVGINNEQLFKTYSPTTEVKVI